MTRLFAEPLPARLEYHEGELHSLRIGTARLVVVEVVRRWRVEAEWWADHVARDYMTVRTADGTLCDIYGDRRSGAWWLQRIMD
ncbi:MAG: hypothetical protein ABR525_04340 [Candidatus Limnocylindria bacterium]